MRKRTGSFGCLGCFSVVTLTVMTLVGVGAVVWLDPAWLEPAAFWKPARYERQAVLIVSPAARRKLEEERAKQKAEDAARAARQRRFFESRRVETDYDPARGAILKTMEGATLQLPAGSVRERAKIALTPIQQLPVGTIPPNLNVVGPSYHITVGGQEHYTFSRQPRMTIPYVPELLGEGGANGLALYVSHGGKWERLDTVVDTQNLTLSANVPHSSWIFAVKVVVRVAVSGGLSTAVLYQLSATVRGKVAQLQGYSNKAYETPHFTVRYSDTGAEAVHPDTGRLRVFPLRPATAVPGIPNQVVVFAEYLEQCYGGLGAVGAPLSGKHEVFISNLPNVYGLTPPNGPVWLTSDWGESAGSPKFPPNVDEQVRGTIAHELVHVAQGQYFQNWSARGGKWWFETTAPYQAQRYWEQAGKPSKMIQSLHMIDDDGKLLTRPMDIDDSEVNYGYSSFFEYLATSTDAIEVIKKVNAGGDPSLRALDAAIRGTGGKSLGEEVERFAQDYYHDNMWTGRVVPFSVYEGNWHKQLAMISSAPDDFRYLVQTMSDGGVASVNIWGRWETSKVKHLSSIALPIHIGAPRARKGKLVIAVQSGSSPNLSFRVARSTVGRGIPAAGARGMFETLPAGPRAVTMLPGTVGEGGIDRVTVLVTNRSLDQDAAGFDIERWALLAPEWVTSAREGGDPSSTRYSVAWHRSELQDAPKVFGGYNVYRRRVGDPDSMFELVREKVDGEYYSDTPPDAQDYVYTVRVRDKEGNLSEPAPLDATDPFQGTWAGRLSLVDGSLVEPLITWWEADVKKNRAEGRRSIASIKDPGERARAQQRAEENARTTDEWTEKTKTLLRKFEQLLRVGIPFTLEIERKEGNYSMRITEAFFKKLGSDVTSSVKLTRSGVLALTPEKPIPEAEPIFLTVVRPDEIREDGYKIEYEIEGKKALSTMRWVMRRKQQP
jgi:hypothetical protein